MLFISLFKRIKPRIEDVYDVIPKSLTSVARELFRLAVCLKPRLIHRGIQGIEHLGNS